MKRTSSSLLTNSFFALLLCLSTASTLRAVERIQNGGFETGTFAPWTATDPSGFTNVGNDPLFAHSGTYHANLGASPNVGSLSQTFSTVAGAMYQISFFLANDGTPAPGMGLLNSFVTMFNGVPIAALSLAPNSAPFGYTSFTAAVLASGASSTLHFQYRNDDDFFRLDDVSVNGPAPSVPDGGSTLWLALPVCAALLLSHRLKSGSNIG